MTELKTKKDSGSVDTFLTAVESDQRRQDCLEVLAMMEEITGSEAKMWGSSMVGFGSYHYQYASGREGEWFVCGFSPRKTALTLYIMPGFRRSGELMKKLGKHKTGKSCLYIKTLDDIDRQVLRQLVTESVEYMKEKYPSTA